MTLNWFETETCGDENIIQELSRKGFKKKHNSAT